MEGTVATEDVACEDAEADVENAGVVGGEDIPDSRDRDVDSGVGGIAGGGDGGAVVVVVVVAVAVVRIGSAYCCRRRWRRRKLTLLPNGG